MSDTILALILTVILIVSMMVLLPLIQSMETLSRRYSVDRSGEMPDLREDDQDSEISVEAA